jgi:predicted metal-dependent phosphoesterase TrpH
VGTVEPADPRASSGAPTSLRSEVAPAEPLWSAEPAASTPEGAESAPEGPRGSAEPVAFLDLHCHTNASFDCLSDPVKATVAAARRGITHLAITDHDRLDGALRARDGAPDGLTVIVGEEVKTASGDLICLFLQAAVPPGLPPAETIALVREQGGLVGIPHPFDRHRSSMANDTEELDALAGLVDWVETYNARVVFREGNERAQAFALRTGLPGVAVSDAHSLLEVGVASTRVLGDPSTPSGLLAALASAEVQPGHATYFARGLTPLAKLVQRARGNGRIRRAASGGRR